MCLCVCGIAGVLVSSRVCGIVGVLVSKCIQLCVCPCVWYFGCDSRVCVIVGVVMSSASNCAFVFVMVYVRICCIVRVVMSSASNSGDNSN